MIAKKLLSSISISWLLMTLFVDIKAVPTIFRNISSRLEAGRVGMEIFSSFNKVELIFAFLILMLFIRFIKIKKMLLVVVPLIILPIAYNFYLTPEITEISLKLGLALQEGLDPSKLEASHEVFHSLYTKLDGLKIFLLCGLSIFSFLNTEKSIV